MHSGNTCVTVTGTTFNVRNYDDESEIIVTLLEGSVVLNTDSDEVALTPGYCAVVSHMNGEIDTRRGRKLYPGDVVVFDGEEIKIEK